MVALDRLGWTASASARAFGVRVGVRVSDLALLPKLVARLPPGARVCRSTLPVDHVYSCIAGGDVPGTRVRRFWKVYAGLDLEARTLDEDAALDAFEGRARFDVALNATRWTFVHAGAVGWKGRAILIPGESMSGKSRLVEALVRAGATDDSDEYAVLDSRGRLYPFAKPLAIRMDDGRIRRVTAEHLGGRTGTRALPVGLIVATRYTPGTGWNPVTVAPGEGVLTLLGHTVRARIAPARVLKTLARAVEAAAAIRSARGEAEETAHELLHGAPSRRSELREIA